MFVTGLLIAIVVICAFLFIILITKIIIDSIVKKEQELECQFDDDDEKTSKNRVQTALAMMENISNKSHSSMTQPTLTEKEKLEEELESYGFGKTFNRMEFDDDDSIEMKMKMQFLLCKVRELASGFDQFRESHVQLLASKDQYIASIELTVAQLLADEDADED